MAVNTREDNNNMVAALWQTIVNTINTTTVLVGRGRKQNHAVWQHQKHTQESFSDHNTGSTNRLFLADLDQVLLLLQLELLQQQWYSDFTVAVQSPNRLFLMVPALTHGITTET